MANRYEDLQRQGWMRGAAKAAKARDKAERGANVSDAQFRQNIIDDAERSRAAMRAIFGDD